MYKLWLIDFTSLITFVLSCAAGKLTHTVYVGYNNAALITNTCKHKEDTHADFSLR